MSWKLHWFPVFLLLLLRKSHKDITFLTFCIDHQMNLYIVPITRRSYLEYISSFGCCPQERGETTYWKSGKGAKEMVRLLKNYLWGKLELSCNKFHVCRNKEKEVGRVSCLWWVRHELTSLNWRRQIEFKCSQNLWKTVTDWLGMLFRFWPQRSLSTHLGLCQEWVVLVGKSMKSSYHFQSIFLLLSCSVGWFSSSSSPFITV